MNTKLFTLLSVLILIALLIPALYRYRSGTIPSGPTPTLTDVTPKSTVRPSIDPSKPSVSAPQPNARVKSPLGVKGTVPTGWMFEGVFPVKLLDADRNVIAEGQAKETVPGSWQSGSAVEFTATISFTTSEKSGFILLEKDNPSGLPEHAGSFEQPVTFR